MTSKICNKCGNKVDESTNFCPYCKSQSFRPVGEITVADNSTVHRLFYWRHGNNYILAKTKTVPIFVFLAFIAMGLFSPGFSVMMALGIIFSVFTYVVGYAIHSMYRKPSQLQLDYNDYGLVTDFKHLILFWQDKKTGAFYLSKTKIISLIIFGVISISGALSGNLAAGMLGGIIFAVPAFLIGFIIHTLTKKEGNTTPEPKKIKKPKEIKKVKEINKSKENKVIETPQKQADPELLEYKGEVKALQAEFKSKEKTARELIEKRFAPPQLTYSRFIDSVDKASTIFDEQSQTALNIINLASDDTERITNELNSKINILKSIIKKIDDLTDELVISMDSSKKDDVENLIGEMDSLIDSVGDYK